MLFKSVSTMTITRKEKGKKVSEKLGGVLQFDVFRMNIKQDSVVEFFVGKGFTLADDM